MGKSEWLWHSGGRTPKGAGSRVACAPTLASGFGPSTTPSLHLLSYEMGAVREAVGWGDVARAKPQVTRHERWSLGSKCVPSPLFSRTVYYTGYRQVYAMEAQTVLRCCPGWSQQPGHQGCLSGECPACRP